MTNIKINKNYIEISGHSGYANIGKDIVCASISTLSYATINYLNAIGIKTTFEDKEGYLKFSYKNDEEKAGQILEEFKNMVKDLEQQYPNNIKVEELEI